jgi:hypothetical protein
MILRSDVFEFEKWDDILKSKKHQKTKCYCDTCSGFSPGRGLGDNVHMARIREYLRDAILIEKISTKKISN